MSLLFWACALRSGDQNRLAAGLGQSAKDGFVYLETIIDVQTCSFVQSKSPENYL